MQSGIRPLVFLLVSMPDIRKIDGIEIFVPLYKITGALDCSHSTLLGIFNLTIMWSQCEWRDVENDNRIKWQKNMKLSALFHFSKGNIEIENKIFLNLRFLPEMCWDFLNDLIIGGDYGFSVKSWWWTGINCEINCPYEQKMVLSETHFFKSHLPMKTIRISHSFSRPYNTYSFPM